MTGTELDRLLQKVQQLKCETQELEIKSAHRGCPERLYDTLSSFSNQDDGGVLLFGVDENSGFSEPGVYDAQDLQKRVVEQCKQMEPPVRPLFTVLERGGRTFVAAEIPGIDVADRPCFYSGKGRLKGSYVRVGDSDEPMTEYEVYSYEAFRKKYQDDVRPIERATMASLDGVLLTEYLHRLKRERPNLSRLNDDTICELMSVTRNGTPTLSSVLLFGAYPQAYFPQLSILATMVPGTEIGDVGPEGERFLDNQRIEGTLPQMLSAALAFVKKNTNTTTAIHAETGKRIDRSEYPVTAVREAILNALIHRDYSIHTEGMPIQLILFEDRMEIQSPGGLYGRLRIDQLGKTQPDTRNPVLAVAMETLNETENRYSGIPTIYRELREAGLPEPEFRIQRGTFSVCFRKKASAAQTKTLGNKKDHEALLEFCAEYRSRQEIADYLRLSTISHAIKKYVTPLVEQGLMELEYPQKPKSPKQRYRAVQ